MDDVDMPICSAKCPLLEYASNSDNIFFEKRLILLRLVIYNWRLLKDENGTNRPACSYVRPLRAGRLLDTPRQAARFVSLLAYEKVTTLGGGGRGEQWTSMHAFLCRSKGVRLYHSWSFTKMAD